MVYIALFVQDTSPVLNSLPSSSSLVADSGLKLVSRSSLSLSVSGSVVELLLGDLMSCCWEIFFSSLGLDCCLMSGKGKKAASPSGSKLQPTVLHDSLGAYITVTCGSLSGNLYLSRLDASIKSQSKCVVVSGKWYTRLILKHYIAGKKARKWRQSLHHQRKPLSLYLSLVYLTLRALLRVVSRTCQLVHKMLI